LTWKFSLALLVEVISQPNWTVLSVAFVSQPALDSQLTKVREWTPA
jgi:hypothetical protein